VFCRFISVRSKVQRLQNTYTIQRGKTEAEMTKQRRQGGKRKRRVAAAVFRQNSDDFSLFFSRAMFRTFQLVISAGTVFFSHNKSTGTVFWLVFSAKRMGPSST